MPNCILRTYPCGWTNAYVTVVRSQQQICSGTRGAQGDRATAVNRLFQKQEDLEDEQATFANWVAQHLPCLKRMVSGLTRHEPNCA
jgi:hypothetical protein